MTNAEKVVFTDVVETELIESSIVASVAKGMYKTSTPVVEGSAVEIIGTEKITIGDYSGTMTHQTLAGTKQVVAIDKVPYFSVLIDDVEDYATAPKNLKTKVGTDAGKELALKADAALAALYTKAKVTVTGAKSDIGGVIEGVAAELDIANVPEGERAIMLDPVSARMLVTQQATAIGGDNAGAYVYKGYIGNFQGVEIFKSNQIEATTTVKHCIGFDMTALNMPRNFEKVREETDADVFGVYVQGVMSFGIDFIETETGKSNRLVGADIDHA